MLVFEEDFQRSTKGTLEAGEVQRQRHLWRRVRFILGQQEAIGDSRVYELRNSRCTSWV